MMSILNQQLQPFEVTIPVSLWFSLFGITFQSVSILFLLEMKQPLTIVCLEE